MKRIVIFGGLVSFVLITAFLIYWMNPTNRIYRQIRYLKSSDVALLKCSDFEDAILGAWFKRPRAIGDYQVKISYVGSIGEITPSVDVEGVKPQMPSQIVGVGLMQAYEARQEAFIKTLQLKNNAIKSLRQSFILCSVNVEAGGAPFNIVASVTAQESGENLVEMEMP